MITALESGTLVSVGGPTKTWDAKISLHIGTVSTGDFCLHMSPAEAILVAEGLIQAANEVSSASAREIREAA